MLRERTTTTGDSVPVTHINAFHIINADVTIIPKINADSVVEEKSLVNSAS